MSDWKLLNTSTASNAANVSFTDLTGYKIFKFVFIDVNPATDNVKFQFNGSDDASSHTYDITKTTTYFDVQCFTQVVLAGEFILYNPASTTYVKHWTSKYSYNFYLAGARNGFSAGYVNTTSAVNAIKFYSSSGNIEGTIKMWGIT